MRQLVGMTRERRLMLTRWVACDSAAILMTDFAAQSLSARSLLVSHLSLGFFLAVVVVIVVTVFLLWFNGLYSVQAKYLGASELWRLFLVCLVSSVLFGLFQFRTLQHMAEPLFAPTLYGFCLPPLLVGLRLIHRRFESASPGDAPNENSKPGIRTILLGGGDAGEMVVREVQRMSSPVLKLIGIVDDDPRKSYTRVRGVPVLGTTAQLGTLVKKLDIEEILIAVPSATGEAMRQLTSACIKTGAKVRTLPGVQDLIAGKMVSNQIREIEITDLLRRPTVPQDLSVAGPLVAGKVILITGAGGSIGGELARQVARLRPAQLVLVGKGENSIFEIEQSILAEGWSAPTAIIADVRDPDRMDQIFSRYNPEVVFHAAAYKHVPLMESNPIEAVRNNIVGTLTVVEMALRHSARHLIFVSTDKAVNPANVMGATKRVAEQIVRCWTKGTSVQSAIVRFGNVLGSRGSLIPTLKAQILRGGPVTITHPDMTRFFMTIPEAVQLVIYAGAMERTGETYILDMGEPLRILDMARDLIRLHGFEPDQTMQIVFTGIRPGEKLVEELSYRSEDLIPTPHPKIRLAAASNTVNRMSLHREIDNLRHLCDQGNELHVRQALMALVAIETQSPIYALVESNGTSKASLAAKLL